MNRIRAWIEQHKMAATAIGVGIVAVVAYLVTRSHPSSNAPTSGQYPNTGNLPAGGGSAGGSGGSGSDNAAALQALAQQIAANQAALQSLTTQDTASQQSIQSEIDNLLSTLQQEQQAQQTPVASAPVVSTPVTPTPTPSIGPSDGGWNNVVPIQAPTGPSDGLGWNNVAPIQAPVSVPAAPSNQFAAAAAQLQQNIQNWFGNAAAQATQPYSGPSDPTQVALGYQQPSTPQQVFGSIQSGLGSLGMSSPPPSPIQVLAGSAQSVPPQQALNSELSGFNTLSSPPPVSLPPKNYGVGSGGASRFTHPE